jgi:hypothetical protein
LRAAILVAALGYAVGVDQLGADQRAPDGLDKAQFSAVVIVETEPGTHWEEVIHRDAKTL